MSTYCFFLTEIQLTKSKRNNVNRKPQICNHQLLIIIDYGKSHPLMLKLLGERMVACTRVAAVEILMSD